MRRTAPRPAATNTVGVIHCTMAGRSCMVAARPRPPRFRTAPELPVADRRTASRRRPPARGHQRYLQALVEGHDGGLRPVALGAPVTASVTPAKGNRDEGWVRTAAKRQLAAARKLRGPSFS